MCRSENEDARHGNNTSRHQQKINCIYFLPLPSLYVYELNIYVGAGFPILLLTYLGVYMIACSIQTLKQTNQEANMTPLPWTR
jgi:hypothetical protein